jgi:hypothetical protein
LNEWGGVKKVCFALPKSQGGVFEKH